MEVDASTEQQPAKPDEGPGIPADTTARDDAPGPAVAAAPAAGGEAVPEGGDAKPASAPLPPAAPPPPPPGPVSLPLFEKWGCKGAPDVDEILTFDEILRGAAGDARAGQLPPELTNQLPCFLQDQLAPCFQSGCRLRPTRSCLF